MNVAQGLLAQTVNQNPLLQDSFLSSKWFNPDYLFVKGIVFFHQLYDYTFTTHTLTFLHNATFFLALFFLTIISYSIVRLFEIRDKEHKHIHHEIAEYAHHQAEKAKKAQESGSVSNNPRWMQTLTYLFSDSSSDWKLAIIEADTMLESLMGELGFKGENLGERLRMANQENFPSLTSAWEVHTIRNKIAHEGLNFDISQYEAKRVIAIYESIFRQYGFI